MVHHVGSKQNRGNVMQPHYQKICYCPKYSMSSLLKISIYINHLFQAWGNGKEKFASTETSV